jgi:hypothetical protein
MSTSSQPSKEESDDGDSSCKSETSGPVSGSYTEGRSASAPAEQPSGVIDPRTGRVCDELAQLINRNFMSAAMTNVQHLGINLSALRSGTTLKTPRLANRQVPATLTPVELQYQVAHDPIIDTIPHARLRSNILRGIAAGQINAAAFSESIRASGALEQLGGTWQRGGVVVWCFPEQVASWELTELFVRRWRSVLGGCEDLITATNVWRGRRSERLLPFSFG